MSYNRIVPSASSLTGEAKYSAVVGAAFCLKPYLDTIFLFDSIILNWDRHMRNFGILDVNDTLVIPLFDNGSSLFANKTVKYIRNAMKSTLSYQPCKPFFSTFKNQIKLLDLRSISLVPVRREWLKDLVYSVYEGERAKLLLQILIQRLEEYNLCV